MPNSAKDRAYVLTVQNSYRLKWHKLLIYFGLWLSAAQMLYLAVMLLLGAHYGDAQVQTTVYSTFPNLRYLDVAFGVAYLGTAAYFVRSRNKIALLQKRGVRGAIIATILASVLDVFYQIGFEGIIGDVAGQLGLDISFEALLQSSITVLILVVYYHRRRDILE